MKLILNKFSYGDCRSYSNDEAKTLQVALKFTAVEPDYLTVRWYVFDPNKGGTRLAAFVEESELAAIFQIHD